MDVNLINNSSLKSIFLNKSNEKAKIFLFFCEKVKVELRREDFEFNGVKVYTMSYMDFNPLDYLNDLTPLEIERFYTFKHIQRKREFVATRVLRHQIFGFEHIHYDEVGAPYINQEGYISISHTKNLVGLALCKKFKIGFDLERIQNKITNIKHKFISERELNHFENSPLELTKAWSAKETLYKLSGKKGLNFRTNIELEKVTKDNWNGTIKLGSSEKSTKIKIEVINNTVLSLNISACG